jgi:methylated-DNA-[protein]-cysteine S-methyltransferase
MTTTIPQASTPTARLAVDSPIGTLLLEGDDDALTHLRLPGHFAAAGDGTADGDVTDAPRAVAAAAEQLAEYFDGERTGFQLALAPDGTPFQRDVWTALADIPYGHTMSYGELAATVGRPHAFRAVGNANGANPIPIIVPCHRVLASGGRIGGYGGGLDAKRTLLALEGVSV